MVLPKPPLPCSRGFSVVPGAGFTPDAALAPTGPPVTDADADPQDLTDVGGAVGPPAAPAASRPS